MFLLLIRAANVCSDCSFQGQIGGQPPVTAFLNTDSCHTAEVEEPLIVGLDL